MPANISSPVLQNAKNRIAQLGDLGAGLIAAVDKKNTRISFSTLISGGFTLNVINTIFVDPHMETRENFDILTCILAHECSHIQQGHLVDSVEQETLAYQVQAKICELMNFDFGKQYYGKFLALDPAKESDLDTALKYIIEFAGGSLPTQTIYKSLPKFQPKGIGDNIVTAFKQLSAAGMAGIQSYQLSRKA